MDRKENTLSKQKHPEKWLPVGQMSAALQEEYPILPWLTLTPGPPWGRSVCVASPLCVPNLQQKVVTPQPHLSTGNRHAFLTPLEPCGTVIAHPQSAEGFFFLKPGHFNGTSHFYKHFSATPF